MVYSLLLRLPLLQVLVQAIRLQVRQFISYMEPFFIMFRSPTTRAKGCCTQAWRSFLSAPPTLRSSKDQLVKLSNSIAAVSFHVSVWMFPPSGPKGVVQYLVTLVS
jgi:hypothetical protein